MGPSPSWTPLLNQRLMAHCPSLCTGNPLTLTSTYSGTVTIITQPQFSVIHTLSHRASTVCSKPELLQQGKGPSQEGSHDMQISQMGFEQGGEKTKPGLPDQVTDGGTTSAQPATNES